MKRRWVWLLWLAAAIAMLAIPGLLADPAMWSWLVDPELLALLVVMAVRYPPVQARIVQAIWVRRFQGWYAALVSRAGPSPEPRAGG